MFVYALTSSIFSEIKCEPEKYPQTQGHFHIDHTLFKTRFTNMTKARITKPKLFLILPLLLNFKFYRPASPVFLRKLKF